MAAFIFVLEVISNLMRIDLALRASLRQHPRRPPDHPVHGRRPGGAARHRRRSASFPLPIGARSCTCSRSAWSRRCRRSSSPPCLPSTSAARSPSPTSKGVTPVDLQHDPDLIFAQARTRATAPTPARRSRSASAAVSAPSAPASASASSSARSSSRSPVSPRCATRSRRSSGSASRSPRRASSTASWRA